MGHSNGALLLLQMGLPVARILTHHRVGDTAEAGVRGIAYCLLWEYEALPQAAEYRTVPCGTWELTNILWGHVAELSRVMPSDGTAPSLVRSEETHPRHPQVPCHLQTRTTGFPVRLMMRAPSVSVPGPAPATCRTHEDSGERELISTLVPGPAEVNGFL